MQEVNCNGNGELAERRLVGEIRKGGEEAIAVGGEMSNAGDVKNMLDGARQAFGPVDIVVANAATSPRTPGTRSPR